VEQQQQDPDDSIIEMAMSDLEDSYMRMFVSFAERGLITKEIRQDYLQFCEEARKIFKKSGYSFDVKEIEKTPPQQQLDSALHRALPAG
jgi:hypothetical protein